jgi:hypothetical protein
MFPKDFGQKLYLLHLINKLSTQVLDNKSPLEVLGKTKINLDHLKIFGCTCFVHIKRHDKFDKNALKIIFLGYSSKQKCYKYFDPHKQKLYISRNVHFFENEPFYKEVVILIIKISYPPSFMH